MMRPHRYFWLATCFLLSLPCFAQKEDWLPVTPADLQLKQVPGDPGAPAIQLYYANYIDDREDYEFVYKRIKVLNESGKKYADVEIDGVTGVDVSNLKARTIHPDGTIVEFTGKPFEKTLFKGRGIKVYAKTFTLPDVTVGSIVEYKYKQRNFPSDNWILQHDLYTLREYFSFQPSHIDAALSWSGRNITDKPPTKKSGGWELEWQDVPGFQEEASMPPPENYKASIHFYYVRSDITNTEKFWETVGKELNEYYERYIGNRKEVKEAALEAIGSETDPEKKLRKLYDRAQQIRNMSYERERTEQERKKEKIKENENLGDLLKRGYGDNEDITALFVGMARATGFDASLLLVSNRRDAFFSNKLLTLKGLGGRMALVKLNGHDVYLQPGVLFCPYGLLRGGNTATDALKFDKKGSSFLTVPPLTSERSMTRRTANMTLDEEGALKGEIKVEFQGQEALEHRLDARDSDEAGKTKDLEDELKAWLPGGATVKLVDVQGWTSPNEPLVARLSVELSGYASAVGQRLLLPPLLFLPQQKDAFTHSDRKYPVYYPYAFTEHDRIVIKLPAGFVPESIPQKQDVTLPYARYQSVSVSDGKTLISERALDFNAIFVQLAQYAELKNFMAKG